MLRVDVKAYLSKGFRGVTRAHRSTTRSTQFREYAIRGIESIRPFVTCGGPLNAFIRVLTC